MTMDRELLDQWLARWRGLQPRERVLVAAGGSFLAVILLYTLLWLPVQRDIDRLRIGVPKERDQLILMRVQASQVTRLRATGSTPESPGNLMTHLEQSAVARGLRQNITRMEPEDTNAARVSIDGVRFDNLIGWLADLQRQRGLRIQEATIESQPEPGVVNARLLMRGPGT